MAVAVNQPRAKEEKDPLDTILKGLQIASGIYGIKEAGEKAELLKQEAAAKREAEAFNKTVGQASLLKAGYKANKDESGNYALEPIQGFKDIETEKTRAEIDKLKAEAEKARRDNGLDQKIKELNYIKASRELERDKGEKYKFEALPKDAQLEVESLSKKVTDRKAVLSDMEALIAQLKDPNLPVDQKVIAGEASLKLLNSVQGPDALSNDEAERQGNLLKYRMRITDPGNFIGRDLPLFTKKVEDQANRIRESAFSMESRVSSLMGKPGVNVKLDLKKAGGGFDSSPGVVNAGSGTDIQSEAQKILLQRQGIKSRLPK